MNPDSLDTPSCAGLSFHLRDTDILEFDDGSCHPATREEGVMWTCIREQQTALARALSTLAIGREFVDVSSAERQNWKGHAHLVEQEINSVLDKWRIET